MRRHQISLVVVVAMLGAAGATLSSAVARAAHAAKSSDSCHGSVTTGAGSENYVLAFSCREPFSSFTVTPNRTLSTGSEPTTNDLEELKQEYPNGISTPFASIVGKTPKGISATLIYKCKLKGGRSYSCSIPTDKHETLVDTSFTAGGGCKGMQVTLSADGQTEKLTEANKAVDCEAPEAMEEGQ